jgi:hypothetical protein
MLIRYISIKYILRLFLYKLLEIKPILFFQLNLQNEEVLKQLHTMQERVGFGNPIAC